MNIAVIGYAHPFGENGYYGAERQIYYLIKELRKIGHNCVVFTIPGCVLPGFDYVKIEKPWNDETDLYWEAIQGYEKSKGIKFDFIYSYMASGFISLEMRGDYSRFALEPFMSFHRFPNNIVSYSNLLNYINGGQGTVIHYGVPEELYSDFDPVSGDYLVWIGRMDHGKAPDIAIEAAKRAGERIVLMGPSYHYPYFVDNIWPHIDDQSVVWLRAVNDRIKKRVFRKAKGFVSTNWSEYHEMFGITNIEALASGCPVIGIGNRNAPSAINFHGGEIIEDGKQGFIIEYENYSPEEKENTINRLVESIKNIGSINREDCYSLFRSQFTSEIASRKRLNYMYHVKEQGKVYNITGEI